MENQPGFFDFAAEVGLTKHIGSVAATEELAELCHIGPGQTVLDVGCGVGVTPCFLAERYGCRVVGVDILAEMVERARERAAREKLSDRVEFRVADAQDLPFADATFDAVITESVTAFPADKQRAVDEYARVARPGGYVGLNESVWRKVPPPPEVLAWVEQEVGATVKPLEADEWTALLQRAGLQEIIARTYAVDTQDEAKGIVGRYGLGGMLRVLGRMLLLYAKSPHYRKFVKRVRQGGIMPQNLEEYFGYGLFVGQKQP